jgi:hypothetical protein
MPAECTGGRSTSGGAGGRGTARRLRAWIALAPSLPTLRRLLIVALSQ